MHDLFKLLNAITGFGRLVLIQFPDHSSRWHKLGLVMFCLSIVGPIVLACVG